MVNKFGRLSPASRIYLTTPTGVYHIQLVILSLQIRFRLNGSSYFSLAHHEHTAEPVYAYVLALRSLGGDCSQLTSWRLWLREGAAAVDLTKFSY